MRLLVQAPNELLLQADQIKGDALDKYKVARRQVHEYRAAARLWAKGVPMSDAIKIVSEAFDEVLDS